MPQDEDMTDLMDGMDDLDCRPGAPPAHILRNGEQIVPRTSLLPPPPPPPPLAQPTALTLPHLSRPLVLTYHRHPSPSRTNACPGADVMAAATDCHDDPDSDEAPNWDL